VRGYINISTRDRSRQYIPVSDRTTTMVPATHSSNHVKISACGGAFIKYTTKIKLLAKAILKDIDNKKFKNSEYSITLAKVRYFNFLNIFSWDIIFLNLD